MKNIIIGKSIKFIQNNNNDITDKDLEKIRYGLEGVYLTLTKFLFISLFMIYFNLFLHFLIFTFFFSIIRMFAFGLHASKSYLCFIFSSLLFILCPLLALNVEINIWIKFLLCLFSLTSIVLYAPADTLKRPLINKKKNRRFKSLSIFIALIYIFFIILINNNFISNIMLFALTTEAILILPITYKIFKLPYRNYKNYHYNLT